MIRIHTCKYVMCCGQICLQNCLQSIFAFQGEIEYKVLRLVLFPAVSGDPNLIQSDAMGLRHHRFDVLSRGWRLM